MLHVEGSLYDSKTYKIQSGIKWRGGCANEINWIRINGLNMGAGFDVNDQNSGRSTLELRVCVYL